MASSLDSLPPPPPLAAPSATPAPAPARRDALPAAGSGMEFRSIVAGFESSETDAVATKLAAALAAAPSDTVRSAIRAEVSRSADNIRMAADEGDGALARLMERIISQASRLAMPVQDTPPLVAHDSPPPAVHDAPSVTTLASSDVPLPLSSFPSPPSAKTANAAAIDTAGKEQDSKEDSKEVARLSKLIDDTGLTRARLASYRGFDQEALDAASREPDPAKRARAETAVYARVIAQNEEARNEVVKHSPAAYHALAREFPDIAFPPIPDKRPQTTPYETELMRRAGANASIPPTQAGNRITFATNETNADGYVKMTMDVSHEPPTVMRHGPNGTLIPVNLEWSRSFDRAYGLMRASESLVAELENLRNRRDQLLKNAENIGEPLWIKVERGDSALETIDSIIKQVEVKFDQDKQGTPPKADALDSALAGALDGGDIAAIRNVEAPTPAEAMRGAEKLMSDLKGIRAEVAKLEEEIPKKEAQKLQIDTEKSVADEEFSRHLKEADANAQANMKSLEDSGADLLGNEGVRKLVELLNLPNVRATIPHGVKIDFSKPLHKEEKLYIARGMEKLFGADSGLYDETGALRQEAMDKRDGLREKLRSRGILDDVGEVRPFALESVFLASLTKPRS